MNSKTILLSQMQPGERGRIVALEYPADEPPERLLVLGLLPGEELVLEQRFPGFLIRFGCTRLAVNRKVADMIRVSKMTGRFGIR